MRYKEMCVFGGPAQHNLCRTLCNNGQNRVYDHLGNKKQYHCGDTNCQALCIRKQQRCTMSFTQCPSSWNVVLETPACTTPLCGKMRVCRSTQFSTEKIYSISSNTFTTLQPHTHTHTLGIERVRMSQGQRDINDTRFTHQKAPVALECRVSYASVHGALVQENAA
jgi:hypothetical protein